MTGIEVSRKWRRVWSDIYINCVYVQDRQEGRGTETQVGGQFQKFCVRCYRNNEIYSNTTIDIPECSYVCPLLHVTPPLSTHFDSLLIAEWKEIVQRMKTDKSANVRSNGRSSD
jgi:hypothetical protein